MIEVIQPGIYTTVQDHGRPGHGREGISPGGPADWFAARAANRLVGNDPAAALLECTLVAPSLRFTESARVAITGGAINEAVTWQAVAIDAGATLGPGAIRPGLRAYVAVRGGIAVPEVLGSRSLCQLGRFGGGFGRPLTAGDELPIGEQVAGAPRPDPWPSSHRLPVSGPWEVRAIAGPHGHSFPAGSLARLASAALRVTAQSDRMGMRLRSPALHLHAHEILTTGVTEGAIQVTPSGELIVLLAEHQPTGGYPVIATVIRADLPLLGQARPGDTVHVRLCSVDEAHRAHRRLEGWLSGR